MGATRRVSDREIVDALKKWEGNVSAAAEDLGLARKNLYERVYALGLAPEELRRKRNGTEHIGHRDVTHDAKRGVTYVDRSSTDTVTRRASTSNLSHMPSAEVVEPIRRTKAGPIRLRPDQVDQLREAKFDFMAKHRAEAGESDLLQRFFDSAFGDWLKQALRTEKKA